MQSYKLILFVHVLVAAHLIPSVTMFDFVKWIDKIQKAKPLEFANRVVETFKKGDANEEDILSLVSEGVNLVSIFSSQEETDGVNTFSSQTTGGVKMMGSVITPDSQSSHQSHGNLVGKSITRPVTTINPERPKQSPTTATSDQIVTSSERRRLEFTKTTGGYMLNETFFITDSNINLVQKMVPGFSSLFPHSDQSLEQTIHNKIILLVAKTADGFLVNDSVVIHDDSLSLAREAAPWLNNIFPGSFEVKLENEANHDHLKGPENSAGSKTCLFYAMQILLVFPLFQIIQM